MLAYPSFALLKMYLPDAQLYALVPSYTKDMAELCPEIDRVLIDPLARGKWHSAFTLAKVLRQEKFDAIITLFSTGRVGLAAALAGIPYRLAPASKFAQFFYNHRLVQRRSRSEKPEFQYNQDLIRYFLQSQGVTTIEDPVPPFFHFDERQTEQLKETFCRSREISPDQGLIFIHPGSGGSANNLSIEQFAKLAINLRSTRQQTIVVTAGPNELDQAEALCKQLVDIPHLLYHSTSGLGLFAQHIQFADLFISGSTGPLHIAGALDVPTAAFYTRRRSATALRWRTLNSDARRLSFSPSEGAHTEDMQSIDVEGAARAISERLLV